MDTFEIMTMKDYHDFYLKYDVILLAYVFEKFRNRSLLTESLFECPNFELGYYI